MEEETSPPVAKKLQSLVRVVFFRLRKAISKSKLMLDLHRLLERSELAGKALDHMLHYHYAAMTCRPNDVHLSFVSPRPREYEFSCSNSPAYPSYYYSSSARRNKHRHHSHVHIHHHGRPHSADDDVKVVQKVLEMLNNETALPEASPLLPGFGRSPMVRQLRVTDSPFPLKDEKEDNAQVDKAAEEFIKKFYIELMHQKKMAALESPSPYHI